MPFCTSFCRRRSSERISFIPRAISKTFSGFTSKAASSNTSSLPEVLDDLLDAATDHGQTQVLVLAQLIANDDQLQVPVPVVFGKLALQDRERFNQPMKVLVGADLSRVKHKWFFKLIPLQHLLSHFRSVIEREPLIQGIVNDRDPSFRQAENIDQIFLR